MFSNQRIYIQFNLTRYICRTIYKLGCVQKIHKQSEVFATTNLNQHPTKTSTRDTPNLATTKPRKNSVKMSEKRRQSQIWWQILSQHFLFSTAESALLCKYNEYISLVGHPLLQKKVDFFGCANCSWCGNFCNCPKYVNPQNYRTAI